MISIVVPVYNVEKYLRGCVESILAQTYRDIEVILVDDGSPDNCGALCEELAAEDGRCRVIHQKNGGLSAARNTGIEAARGEYIAFIDSDDTIAPDMMEKLYRALTENDAQLSICNSLTVNEDGIVIYNERLPYQVLTGREALDRLHGDGWWRYVVAWSRLYKRELFQKLRFPVGKVHEDQFIAHRLFALCRKIVTIPDALYYYARRFGSITYSEIRVNRLDDVEALCDRCRFYGEQGLAELLPPTRRLLRTQYEALRPLVHPRNAGEEQRVAEIDAMFRECYFAGKETDTPWNRLMLSASPWKRPVETVWDKSLKLRYYLRLRGKSHVLIAPESGEADDMALLVAEEEFLHRQELSCCLITEEEIDRWGDLIAWMVGKERGILIHGGCNLGMLHPQRENRFQRLLWLFPENRLTVLPQTPGFETKTALGRRHLEGSRRCYAAHKRLTILVRDTRSLQLMEEAMPEISCLLSPDMTATLPVAQPREDILLCVRDAHRRRAVHEALPGETLTELSLSLPEGATQRRQAARELLCTFAPARLVVTDELPALLLALSAGVPCLALPDSEGWIEGCRPWGEELPLLRFVREGEALSDALHELSRRPREERSRDFTALLGVI